ncbi:MAG: copper resistance protein NlpE [Planctomycetes bacterium]|nr:copper resistance protein NlpE [Planctomycetota bacterium]
MFAPAPKTLLIVAIAGAALGALASCETTSTPVDESKWLPKRTDPAPAVQAESPPAAPVPATAATTTDATSTKPWDAHAGNSPKSALATPSAQQMTEYLSGGTWVLLDENGTRRRSLELKADGSFTAKSDGLSGEKPAFEGLMVQAKGRWSAKSGELRLTPSDGSPVVVQLVWLGDRRLIMMNGESWVRTQ